MRRPCVLPALALSAALVAVAGAAVAPSLQAESAPAVVAEAAVAPVPVTLSAGPSVHEEKALRRDASASALDARAQRAAATQRAAESQRASRSRRAAAVSSDPKGIARSMLAARGQAGQFGCLDSLWTKESEWRVRATNPSSGAYGIPQSLPASKMASAGADWRTSARTQIRWGLDYIDGRYGSPCAAWAHSRSHNWY